MYYKAIMDVFLPMDKLAQEKHTQWLDMIKKMELFKDVSGHYGTVCKNHNSLKSRWVTFKSTTKQLGIC